MAKSAGRKRFGGSSGAPLKISAPPAGTKTASDPFADHVNALNLQLRALQAQAAVKKLADGDPEGFIPMAEERLRAGDTSYPWAQLISQAKQKIDEQEWSDGIKNGDRTLDDFKKHLESQLDSFKAGSPEAQQTLKNLAAVGTAMKAQVESQKDQAALKSYINSGDHTAYKDYLMGKLNRTVDPALQANIVKNIDEMDKRIAASAGVERAQKVSDIMTGFKQGASASETVAKLQEIAHDKSITASEVNHIQTVIDAVFSKVAANATAAAGRAAQAQTAALNKERTQLEQAQTAIANKLKAGQPVTQTDLDKLDTAAAVVQHISEAIASDPNATASASRTAANEAKSAGAAPNESRGLIDKSTMHDFGLDADGTAAFKASIAGKTAAQQAKAWIDRAVESNMALGKLYLDENKKLTTNDSTTAYGMGRRQIAELTKPVPLTDSQKSDLHTAYTDYAEAQNSLGLKPVTETEFLKTLNSTTDPASSAAKLGISPDRVGAWETYYDGNIVNLINRGAKYDVSYGSVIGDPDSKKNLESAMSLQDQLIRAQFGNDVSLDKPGLYYTATGEVSPFDAVNSIGQGDAKVRRGGMNTGDMPMPGDRADQNIPMDSSMPQPYTPDQSPSGGSDAMISDGNGGGVGLGGYLSDQRSELFGNQDAYSGATSYLTQNSFVDVPAWSTPEIPPFDPVITDMYGPEDYFGANRDLYFGDYGHNAPSTEPPLPNVESPPSAGGAYLTE